MMIEHFGVNGRIPWNSSGYGSNDPGRKRDHTAENGTFNDLYPINIDKPCVGGSVRQDAHFVFGQR